MSAKNKIFIVVPAYNEECAINGVLKGLKKHGYKHIVVVDDGSTDRTFENALKEGVIVLRHTVNRGQGAALRTGIDYALRHGADVIVNFDSDGQHDEKDICKLVLPILKGEVEVVLGSRFLGSGSNTPQFKKIVLKGAVLLHKILYGINLTDAHNGLRAMSRKAAMLIDLSCDKMEHASEIIEKIVKNRIAFKEVPVTIRYTDYSVADGQSSMAAFKILFRIIMRKLMR